jgi:hypothetical protein
MATDTGTFSTHLAPTQPGFDQITIDAPIQDVRPFTADGDRNHVFSTEPSTCDRLAYCSPALSVLHPTRPGLYFVGDSDHQTGELDTLYFNRNWSTIPAARVVPIGTYAYRFPGLPAGTVGSPVTLTDLSPDAGTPYITAPTFTAAAHGFSVGDKLLLALTFSGASATVSARIVAKDTNTFTTTGILVIFSGSPGTFTTGTATLILPGRTPDTLPADAIEAYSYALPGVTAGIATPADFRADPVFRILDADGMQTDTLATDTVPTAASYRALVASGAYFVVESGIRRYAGEILERRTLMVRYT